MAVLDIRASIRINDGNPDVDYVNVFPLHTAPYKITTEPTIALSGQSPTVTTHDSDDGPPEVINLEEENRTWAFTMRVTGATPAEVGQNLSTLKRHIQGKQSTAYQAYRNGSQPDVVFRMQLTPSSPTTDFIIQYGRFQDNNSYYSTAALKDESTIGVLVNLICSPAGRGVTEVLVNALSSSPHMIEDSNADGTADGVTNTGGGFGWSTLTLVSGGIVGGQYQLNTAFSGAVTRSALFNTVTVSQSSNIVSYFICRIQSGDPVRLYLLDGAGTTIQTKTLTINDGGGIASRSYTDSDGNVWFKVELVGSNTGAANCALRWERNAADNTGAGCLFWLDAVYLQINTTVVPNAFSSASAIENRYDPIAGNESRINYLDVALVGGDMPAPYDLGYNGFNTQTVARRVDGDQLAALALLERNANLMVGFTGWAFVNDASVVGGRYFTSSAPNLFNLTTLFTSDEVYKTFSEPVRIYAVIYADSLSTVFDFNFLVGNESIKTKSISVQTINEYHILDLGVINLRGIIPPEELGLSVEFTINLNLSGTGTARMVMYYIYPTSGFTIAQTGIVSPVNVIYSSQENKTYQSSGVTGLPGINPGGNLRGVIPEKMNRFIFTFSSSSFQYIPTLSSNPFDTSIEITPIASHLIGDS